MQDENKQPMMSVIPFEGLMNEITKLQGDRPALVVLYSGKDDLTVLKSNLDWDGATMEMFMRHLTIEVLKSRGAHITIVGKDERST